MKRTTYILIGLIVSGLVVIVTFIVLISVSGQSHKNGFFVYICSSSGSIA